MDKSIHSSRYHRAIGLLRFKREAKGITQSQLAGLLGVSQGVVSKMETCERRIDIIELRTICNVLDVSLVAFVQELEELLSTK